MAAPGGASCAQEAGFFAEHRAFAARLGELAGSAGAPPSALDGHVEFLSGVLARYQEQPHLLDPHLGAIVGTLMGAVRTPLRVWHARRVAEAEAAAAAGLLHAFPLQLHTNRHVHACFRVLYALCKTRGAKTVAKFLPHEVADLEPAAQSLTCQDTTDHSQWETRYGLLLWLSVLVLLPFDLSTADSFSSLLLSPPATATTTTTNPSAAGGGGGSSGGGLVPTLVSVCSTYLADPGPVREAAAVCLARLLTRPDMEGPRLHAFATATVDTLAVCVLRPSRASTSVGAAARPTGSVLSSGSGGRRDHHPSSCEPGGGGDSELLGVGLFGEASGLVGGATAAAAAVPPAQLAARTFLVTGLLQTLAHIAKFGHRRALGRVIGDVFDRIVAITSASASGGGGGGGGGLGLGATAGSGPAAPRSGAVASVQLRSSPLLRKLLIKLAGRTGLTYLPPRLQPWRYARGSRSLVVNLAASGVPGASSSVAAAGSGAAGAGDGDGNGDDDDVYVPPQMEDIIDLLLSGLRDCDTVVRWAAAKGVGRVTGRLPLELADDVVAAVLALLAPTESDAAWHGGCLALAELGRRGLLLPSRLPDAVPLVLAALAFDVRRGSHSVGAHVRDAACYVCWAFARAYEPGVMAAHLAALARGMLTTALFDREVNCRRAAAAAFQENVGRQGAQAFPFGIEILTAADYFTLGNRGHAFTAVAPAVAAFAPYRSALREHVLGAKLRHWDPAVRLLSARALAALAVVPPVDEAWLNTVALPALLPAALSPELFVRHGATHALAELVLAVAAVPRLALAPDHVDEVRNVVVKAEKGRAYTGRGGESVRAAMCRLIACQCLAGHALSRKAALRLLQTLDDCLKHPNSAIQADATAALRALAVHALCEPEPALLDRLPRGYVQRLRTEDNPAVRRGLALALGALPKPLLCARAGGDGSSGSAGGGAPPPRLIVDDVLDALISATKQERLIQARDAETRRNAAVSLAALVRTVGIGHRALVPPAVPGLPGGGGGAGEVADGSPGASHAHSTWSAVVAAELQPGLSTAQFQRVLSALVDCSWDYAVDNRGDVGSWVRHAALRGIEAVVYELLAAAWAQEQARCRGAPPTTGGDHLPRLPPLPSAALPAALLAAFPARTPLLASLPPSLSATDSAAASALQHALNRPAALVSRTGLVVGSLVRRATPSPAAALSSPSGASPAIVGRIVRIGAAGAIAEVEWHTEPEWGGADADPRGQAPPPSSIEPVECLAAAGEAANRALACVVLVGAAPSGSTSPDAHLTPTTATAAAAAASTGVGLLEQFLPAGGALVPDVVAACLRIGAEKLDRLRGVACETLCRLLHAPAPLPQLPCVPHRNELCAAFPAPPGVDTTLAAAQRRVPPSATGAAATFGDSFAEEFGAEDAEVGGDGEEVEETPSSSEGGVSSSAGDGGAPLDAGDQRGDAPLDAAAVVVDTAAATAATAAAAAAAAAGLTHGSLPEPAAPSPALAPRRSQQQPQLQWHLPHVAFPRVASLLPLAPYTRAIATGLVTSVGGLSETVVRHSSAALSSWVADALASGRAAHVGAVAWALLALLRPRRKQAWDVLVGGGGGGDDDQGDDTACDGAAALAAGAGVSDSERGGGTSGGSGGGGGVSSQLAPPSRGAAPPAVSAMNLGGYSSAPNAGLSRWFATILGASAGIAGVSGSRDAATVKVDKRLVTPALRTLDALLTQGLLDCLLLLDGAPATPAASHMGGATSAAAAAPGATTSAAAATGAPVTTPPAAVAPAPPAASSFGAELVALTVRRLGTAPDDVPRTLAGSAVLLGLLACPGRVRVGSALALLDLLGHSFPRVRRAVAEALYTRLLALDAASWVGGLGGKEAGVAAGVEAGVVVDGASAPGPPPPPGASSPDLDAAVALLADAEWDAEPARVLPQRDRLYGLLLGLPRAPDGRAQCGGGSVAVGAGTGGAHDGDDAHAASLSGYAALVRDAGY